MIEVFMIYRLNIYDLTLNVSYIPPENHPIQLAQGLINFNSKSQISRTDLDILKHKFIQRDVYSVTEPVYTNIHYHNDVELRIILNGSGRFFVPYQDELFIIEVSANDIIYLQPNVPHWFSSNNILAYRLFQTHEKYTSFPFEKDERLIKIHNIFKDKFTINL